MKPIQVSKQIIYVIPFHNFSSTTVFGIYLAISDRVIHTLFEGGEELFGLTVTEYPNLQRIRKELGLLQKLYNLYNSVIDNVNGYYDILWQEIDIEKINNELMEYQNR